MTATVLNPKEAVSVQYDEKNGRVTKTFDDPQAAKDFFAAMDKKGRKPKVKKPTETKAPKKKGVARDAMGSRVGSQASHINKVISNKPKDRETIAKECGQSPSRVGNHLRFLVNKKLVVETAEGFKTK